MIELDELNPPARLLLGPGPSNVDPRVIKALSSPIVGHLDPFFIDVMDEVKELLKETFVTKNEFTIPLSGTGTAGMEATVCNLVEEGDQVVVGQNGYFGTRLSEIVSRYGGQVIPVKAEWGRPIGKEDVEAALKNSNAKIIAMVHAETSTGVLQPIEEISRLVKGYGAILLLDAVTSLAGCSLKIDEMGVDICYSGTQKCLNCPPGLSPVTVGQKALELVHNRRTRVKSFYLDFSLLEAYWSERRSYHHTAPISMIYALREALRIVVEEGLETRWARHIKNSRALASGIEALGLKMHVEPEYRLPTLNTIRVPDGVDDARVRSRLLNGFNIEVGAGLGELKGKIWRVGLMGINSSEKVVMTFLSALERSLLAEGYGVKLGSGAAAAEEYYSSI